MDGSIQVERESIDTIRIVTKSDGALVYDDDWSPTSIEVGPAEVTVHAITVEEARTLIQEIEAQIKDIEK